MAAGTVIAEPPVEPTLTRRVFLALTSVACALFAAYAGSFLYFFVDDEAIPLVYARNLLRGRGLIYTVLEGRVEGYSDFLHVMWSTVLLLTTRGLHLSYLAPLVIGKGISFAAGVAIIVLTARWLRRSGATAAGLAAGLGFLALAGPLAVWSCSSLEAVTFALMVTGFAGLLLTDARPTAVLLGLAVVLTRIDGVLYAAALLLAAAAADPRRWRNALHVGWPVGLVALAFHAWRYAYFGSILSAPLAAKVLYRLTGSGRVIVKPPDVPYLVGFLQLYGVAAVPILLLAVVVAWRVRAARMAAIGLLLLGVYVSVVGDWMFGWRFAVALLPLAALVLGVAVSRLPQRLGWCAAGVILLGSIVAARNLVHDYVVVEGRPIFWTHPRLGESAWLAPYYDLIAASRRLMHAGDRVAYNQGGLLPYLLDLENIDDLGICSRFVAQLPTTDVYYTGVGRYSPLTQQPVLRTAHAYLLYQDVQFLVTRTDVLRKANHDRIPQTLLDRFFKLVAVDASGANAIYQRTAKPADEFRHDPALFRENLAHTSRLTRAEIDGRTIDPSAFGPELPFLREQIAIHSFDRHMELDLGFGKQDSDVSALYIGTIRSRGPCTITLSLFDGTGRATLTRTVVLDGTDQTVLEQFAPVRARSASLTLQAGAGERITIADVRLEGQSPELRDYIARNLRLR
jgi:hypothetical protein